LIVPVTISSRCGCCRSRGKQRHDMAHDQGECSAMALCARDGTPGVCSANLEPSAPLRSQCAEQKLQPERRTATLSYFLNVEVAQKFARKGPYRIFTYTAISRTYTRPRYFSRGNRPHYHA
jgi:hypothetical protein